MEQPRFFRTLQFEDNGFFRVAFCFRKFPEENNLSVALPAAKRVSSQSNH